MHKYAELFTAMKLKRWDFKMRVRAQNETLAIKATYRDTEATVTVIMAEISMIGQDMTGNRRGEACTEVVCITKINPKHKCADGNYSCPGYFQWISSGYGRPKMATMSRKSTWSYRVACTIG